MAKGDKKREEVLEIKRYSEALKIELVNELDSPRVCLETRVSKFRFRITRAFLQVLYYVVCEGMLTGSSSFYGEVL